MEARTKQQQLLFDKGITNVPSDNLCSDNTLAESVGMVYEDGEHRVIQRPVEFITSAVNSTSQSMDIPNMIYVHTFNDEERFIGWYDTGSILAMTWGYVENGVFNQKEVLVNPDQTPFVYTNKTKVTSVGKTLVVANEEGFHYFLWQNITAWVVDHEIVSGVYKPLGKIPEPEINFWLVGSDTFPYGLSNQIDHEGVIEGKYDYIVGSAGDITEMYEIDNDEYKVTNHESYNDVIIGLYSKNRKTISERKGFCEPFFIRYALRLYDGTYTHISQPILMMPCVRRNSFCGIGDWVTQPNTIHLITTYSQLHYDLKTNGIESFSDIVKGIDIFVTRGITPYQLTVDQPIHGWIPGTSPYPKIIDGVFRNENQTYSVYHETAYQDYGGPNEVRPFMVCLEVIAQKPEDEIINTIKSESLFYKIASLGLKDETGDIASKIETLTLVNLTTQEYLENDDYYSRCTLIPNYIYSYNSRLNLASVKRGFFEGYGFFMPWDNTTTDVYDIYVTIKTDIQDFVVKHRVSTKQKMGYYFYYPDHRATKVVIWQRIQGGDTKVLDTELTEHPGLNGAYYFAGLPSSTPPARDTSGSGSTTVSISPKEELPNYILQSEVDNPWVYQAKGYFKVGTGKIIGMSSITQALSEGQFGSYPLLVFSESGIWALSVADTGYYSSIHPMSREVCNNARSITQTDGAVFFTSEKGLMVIVGNQVKCVSEQLSGKQDLYSDAMFPSSVIGNVSNFFRTCYIAYDYRDSLLWIMGNAPGAEHCYIYSIKSGTFSKYHLPQLPRGCVNYYPDYLIQTNPSGKVYSLLQRPNINLDYVGETTNLRQYTATMLTRPMKMENALALKSIMHLKNIKLFSPYTITENDEETPHRASLTLRIFASNDLENWVERTSLRGVPFKYYRFRFDFADLIATDRFAGTVVVTQERRTDKIR